ncbi:expressed unknown protein [Seminavis robusta]|uniref:Uncharacterized protein n=1 Tax=Seminavis robusta TaxID=568900 RepID=A0A9N8EY53_9STRA|nr:expressed unknown protein [Seminavis robusta]|eukprot:Sro2241_g320370.1 n/a (99) ;mRNA; f:9028-9324
MEMTTTALCRNSNNPNPNNHDVRDDGANEDATGAMPIPDSALQWQLIQVETMVAGGQSASENQIPVVKSGTPGTGRPTPISKILQSAMAILEGAEEVE